MEAPKAERWVCPTCRVEVRSPYCPVCGERPVRPRDMTLRGILGHFFQAVSSIDGRMIRSLIALVTRPGALTVAYMEGPRKPYLGPFQLFLLANVIFVAAQSLTGMNVFSSTLDSHLHLQDWSARAQRMTAERLNATHATLESFTPAFNRTVAWLAKTLVIVMTIPFAAVAALLNARGRNAIGVHAVFAVHVYAFLLLLFCGGLVIAAIDVLFGGSGLESARVDTIITVLHVAVWTAYLYVATGRVYDTAVWHRIITTLTLSVSVLAIILAYRFGLFVVGLYVS